MTFHIAENLVRMAESWPVYEDDEQHVRCVDCDQAIWDGQAAGGRLAHLTLAHGYRMDGRRYNNDNEVISAHRQEDLVV